MLFIKLDRSHRHPPYYLQIVEQIRNAILSAQLASGARLPSTRQLATELGIARRTVVVAYEELCAQGYCTSHIGQGTSVALMPVLQKGNKLSKSQGFPAWLSEEVPSIKPGNDYSENICFTPGLAQVDYLPIKAMRWAFKRVIQHANPELGDYQKNNGNWALLQAICRQILPARGIKAEPNEVLITNGSQHSSSLLSMLLSPYGGGISYGVPGYLAIPRNFTSKGLAGIQCPLDSQGVCLTKKALSARLHYVMPEHHFPLNITLSPQRRASLLQLSERQDALIIEDDYDSEFYYDRHPLPALKAEDVGGRVLYMGTFSKVLFSSLRLGYIVAHPKIIQRLVNLRWQLDGGTSTVLQLWMAELIESGALERHLRRMRIHYRKKRDLIAEYLKQTFPNWSWRLPNGGLQFWIELPTGKPAEMVLRSLAERGVSLYSGAEYYEQISEEATRRLILGFGAVTKAEIHQAFTLLKASP